MNRRAFLLGSTALLAAPSIVRASSLMPASNLRWRTLYGFNMSANSDPEGGRICSISEFSFYPSFDAALSSFARSAWIAEPDPLKWKIRHTGEVIRVPA